MSTSPKGLISRFYYQKIFGETNRYIRWALSPICDEELSFQELLASLGVFSRAILKSQTNKISVKLALMGQILREYTPEKERVFVQGQSGIIINCPIHTQLFKSTENIIHLEEQGNVFVSDEYCQDVVNDVKNLTFLQVDGFLSAFQNMPVELAGDLLCSEFGKKLIKIFTNEIKKNTYTLQEKSYHIYKFLFIRYVLNGMKSSLPKENVKNQVIDELIQVYHTRGTQPTPKT